RLRWARASRCTVWRASTMSPRKPRSSDGYDSTLVGRSLPRCAAFSFRTALSSPSATVRALLRRPTDARAALRTSRSTFGTARRPAGSSTTTSTVVGLRFLVARFIGLDDAGHQVVAHDVLCAQPHEAHAFDAAQRFDRVGHARTLAARQVGLAGIAGDHHA